MKRFVASILALLMMFCFAAAFADDSSTHTHSYKPTDKYKSEWIITSNSHEKVSLRVYACTCGNTTDVVVRTIVPSAPHNLKLTNNWHINSGKHAYLEECSVCNYSRTTTVECSGPPCPTYFSIGFEECILSIDDDVSCVETDCRFGIPW